MVHYSDIGLSNQVDMMHQALEGKYAIPGYNMNNMEQMQAILTACVKSQSPLILQVSKGAREYANETILRYMAQGGVEYANEMADELGLNPIPISLNLDHGSSFELCKSCIDSGFSAVMIDRSQDSIEENIKITARVVEYAHQFDVSVEGELGVLAGIEDDVVAEKTTYTRPEDVERFVDGTGVDCLAIAIGTSHGAYKFKLAPGESPPPLRFDILEAVQEKLPGFPIVLHGSSSIPPKFVDMINKFGGDMEGAVGVPEEQLRKAAGMNVCKINIDSDGRLAVTATIRRVMAEKPSLFDPRKYLGPAREALAEEYIRKNKEVLGSAGKV
ncbi:class II fructose-1,6-bisphosphate aldolase [Candidatus Bathyarchaeota archaeon]|nr:class II fructose-1,6-bisphosphate aldolase [Candidatus Bathyarchaeota archaeon]